MLVQERRLSDLVSIGPAMLRDFELLGIRSVQQLARRNPVRLYRKLCRITSQQVDICCQDVFCAAAKTPSPQPGPIAVSSRSPTAVAQRWPMLWNARIGPRSGSVRPFLHG